MEYLVKRIISYMEYIGDTVRFLRLTLLASSSASSTYVHIRLRCLLLAESDPLESKRYKVMGDTVHPLPPPAGDKKDADWCAGGVEIKMSVHILRWRRCHVVTEVDIVGRVSPNAPLGSAGVRSLHYGSQITSHSCLSLRGDPWEPW